MASQLLEYWRSISQMDRRAKHSSPEYLLTIELDQPISIRRGLADTEPCNYVDLLSSKEILEEQMHYPDLKPILLWLQDNFEPSMMELKLSSKATLQVTASTWEWSFVL